MGAPVMHFEIVGKDGKKLEQFYSSLFDWKIDSNNDLHYGMVDNGGQGINGGVAASQDGQAWAGFYVGVDNLQNVLSKAESLGGKTIMPPMDIPGGPSIAMFTDPEGNKIGLVTGM